MLSKKYVVQKSFRLDSKLESDLEKLALHLNRPQNELVSLALENLMLENKEWFLCYTLVDYCGAYFNNCDECHFTLSNITIDITINGEDKNFTTSCRYIIVHGKDEIEEGTNIYEDNQEGVDKFKNFLIDLGTIYLNKNTPEIEDYIKQRLDYR